MSKHSYIQEKIKTEPMTTTVIDEFSLDPLDLLVCLDCVVTETLHYCPPLNGTIRTLMVDDRPSKSAFQLHENDSVFIPFSDLSHGPYYWSIDHELFYPGKISQ